MEADRLKFVEDTRGRDAAEDFALQTLKVYMMALEDPDHHANLPEYKGGFETSIMEIIDYLLTIGETNGSIA